MTNDQLLERLQRLQDQYFDLVWYARADKTDPNHPGRKAIERIRGECPDQIAA